MKYAFCFLFVLIWLAYLTSSGVLLFSRGFLLSRVSKTEVSTCRRLSTNEFDVSSSNNTDYHLSAELVEEIFKDVNATSNLCLPQKSRVIILVIDALKYEFGLYNESASQDLLPYENKLTIFHELMQESPEQARLMRFVADPPTTTLQRLKGLTTGSLPTFIDIGSNFASPEINEDNIIDQMVQNGLPVVFLGDSTWTDLYPRRFKRSYAYPSFDIFDLDTVDTKIQKNLPKELEKLDWEVLIAHFLGVDHCGHKHGPLHSEMERKLLEMNEMIKNVVAKMDNDTTLLVMGDHGMTASGDHGGDTDDETNALLFAYSKKNKFIAADYGGSDKETLQQIDLTPTLATILGIPIPYSNLGLVNFNIVPDVAVPHMSRFQLLLLHAWQNAQQIYKYFFEYALENKRTFNVEQMDRIETDYILLSHRVKSVYNEVAFRSFTADLNQHIRQVLSTCREIWVRFDPTQMSQGLLFAVLPVFFAFLLVQQSRPFELSGMFSGREVAYTYLFNFAAGVFGYRYYKNFGLKTEEHGVIFFTNILSAVILTYFTVKSWPHISLNWSNTKRFGNFTTRLMLLLTFGVFFSNSFVIQEPKILSYLLVATLMLLVWDILRRSVRPDFRTKFRVGQFLRSPSLKVILATVLAIVCVRCSYALFRCREEQGNCLDFAMKKSGSAKAYLLAVVIIVLYTTLTRLYLRSCGNLTGNAANVMLARYGPTVGAICAGGHILLANSAIKNIQRSHIDAMALVIYALLLIQIIVVSVAPMMIYVLPPKSSNTITVSPYSSVVPEIFKKMKRLYEGEQSDRRYEIPVVYGLATIYSSILIAFGVFLTLALIILLEPKSSIGIVLCVAVGAILLTVHGMLRFRTATSFESCVQPTFTALLGWFLLAHFCFFATSHQTTLSQIDWRAAFVGRSSGIGQNTFISGLLVMMNTFGGQILFFVMYGLLSTETFSLFALFPHLIKTNYNRDVRKLESVDPRQERQRPTMSDISQECVGFDITRGELILFENETTFLGAVFKLASQFYMLQGAKIFCAMMACTIHCRHLMVWKIFAPRFIYEALATFVSLPALIVGFLLIVRIHHAVDGLIRRINKVKSN